MQPPLPHPSPGCFAEAFRLFVVFVGALPRPICARVSTHALARPRVRLSPHTHSNMRSLYRGISARSHNQIHAALDLCASILRLAPTAAADFCTAFDFSLKVCGAPTAVWAWERVAPAPPAPRRGLCLRHAEGPVWRAHAGGRFAVCSMREHARPPTRAHCRQPRRGGPPQSRACHAAVVQGRVSPTLTCARAVACR